MGYNFTGTKPLMITEHEVRLASVASGAYRKVIAVAQAVAELTGNSQDQIMDWLMFHRVKWSGPASVQELVDEFECRKVVFGASDDLGLATLDAEERAGHTAAADEAAWSRYGW